VSAYSGFVWRVSDSEELVWSSHCRWCDLHAW